MDQLQQRVNSTQGQIGDILRAFFLPKEFGNGFRLASEGAGNSTAVANMSQTFDTGDWPESVDLPELGANLDVAEMMVCLFANPLRAYIQYEHNPNGTVFTYNVLNVDGTTTFPIPYSVATELIPRWAVSASAYQPHGNILFPGYDNAGHYYLWVDSGNTTDRGLVVTFSVPPVLADGGAIEWYVWSGKSEELWHTTTITTGVSSYSCAPPTQGAYMFVRVLMAEGILTQTATLSIVGSTNVFAHHSVSNIESLLQQAYGIRVNSAALRIQNDSSPLYRQGKMVSVTVSSHTSWTMFPPRGADYTTDWQGYRERTADTGYYGVLLPDSDDDISEFYDDIAASSISTAQSLNQAAYPLMERRPWKMVAITIDEPQGRSLTFDVTHTIEYLTNNKLVAQTVSNFSEESLTAAIVIASTMETDYENPVHWKRILSTIATYLPLGTKALVTALQLFGYNDIANQIQQRQPLVDKLGSNMYEISTASARNKRGLEQG